MEIFGIDLRLVVIVAALLGIFVLLFCMAVIDDYNARERHRRFLEDIGEDSVWTRPHNETERAYRGWLSAQDWTDLQARAMGTSDEQTNHKESA